MIVCQCTFITLNPGSCSLQGAAILMFHRSRVSHEDSSRQTAELSTSSEVESWANFLVMLLWLIDKHPESHVRPTMK
jgi:hypothetical protein